MDEPGFVDLAALEAHIEAGEVPRIGEFQIEYKMDDIDNGQRFLDKWGEYVRWTVDSECWWIWHRESSCWVVCDAQISQMAKRIVKDIYKDAATLGRQARVSGDAALVAISKQLFNWAKYSAGAGLERMIKRASTDETIRADMSDFDADSCLLNTPGGVVDLKTGLVFEPEPRFLMMKCTRGSVPWLLPIPPPVETEAGEPVVVEAPGVSLGAVAPGSWRGGLWEKFLNYVLPVPAVQDWLQRAMGYASCAGVEERLFVFLKGGTGHGKSKLLEAVEYAMGNYVVSLGTDQFLVDAKNQYGLAQLPGARMIFAAEFDEAARINVTLIKRLTSGERVQVRMIRGAPFEYRPEATIFTSTNQVPLFGGDRAAWARLAVVPFDVALDASLGLFGEADLSAQLQAPAVVRQVMGWLVEGAAAYWASDYVAGTRLQRPTEMLDALGAEIEDQKPLVERFLEECFVLPAGGVSAVPSDGGWSAWGRLGPGWAEVREVYAVFRWWCQWVAGVPEREVSAAAWFGRRLGEAGVMKGRGGGGVRLVCVGQLVGGGWLERGLVRGGRYGVGIEVIERLRGDRKEGEWG